MFVASLMIGMAAVEVKEEAKRRNVICTVYICSNSVIRVPIVHAL
jgi:hypothetical protein